MTKRKNDVKTMQFTAKVHRQHTSLVVTFPKKLAEILEVEKGDIILFEVEPGDLAAVVGRMLLRGPKRGPDKGDSDIRDKGGGT